jgi:hypothetical protein
MVDSPQVLKNFGPISNHSLIVAFGSVSERAFQLYLDASGGEIKEGETQSGHVVTRMMYIARVTSLAVRLNCSWALTHPAFSLLRDRYEQAVRFSWLARQPNDEQMKQYVAAFYGKSIKIFQDLSPNVQQQLKNAGLASDTWLTEKPTKEQKAYLNRWTDLDLRSMVDKRDKLSPLSSCALAKEKLGDFYTTIYAQFSSVADYDMYSLAMLGLHKAPNGDLVLATDPNFPLIVEMHGSLFDLIQCFEATRGFLKIDFDDKFSALFDDWRKLADQIVDMPAFA